MTLDTYCVQHAGGHHPAKSVTVHLAGMYVWNELAVPPPDIPKLHQRLVANYQKAMEIRGGKQTGWPEFVPPPCENRIRILDVAMTETPIEHAQIVKEWSA